LIICEHDVCNEQSEIEAAHSCVIVLQKVDKSGYSFHQCEQGQEVNCLNYQHWHCSHDHMQVGLTRCINEHYDEVDLHPIPTGEGRTILHRMVFGSMLECKVCGSHLKDVAYRFCLTMATPINAIPDDSHNELGEWCCSLDHAKQSALSIVSSMLPV